MKTKFIYPAVFEPEEVGGYSVSFPDLPGCFTEGDTLEDAFDMARDALGLYLAVLEDEGQTIPAASFPSDIRPADKDDIFEWRSKTAGTELRQTVRHNVPLQSLKNLK